VPGTPIIHRHQKSSSSSSSSGYPSPSLPPTAAYTPSSLSPRESGENESITITINGGNGEPEELLTSTPPAISSSSSSSSSYSSSSSSSLGGSQGNPPFSLSRPNSPERNKNANGSPQPHSSTSTSTNSSHTHLPGRPTTPSQFIFKKPEYNKTYHHTHFHHLEKKDTLLHDLKRFFKNDKKKHNKKAVASTRPSLAGTEGRISDLSFANEFNKDLEGRYGKWGKSRARILT
jgi:hypothetical protein